MLAGFVTKKDGRRKVQIDDEAFYVHRIVWKMLHGTEPRFIDHQDNRAPGDNRPTNIRASTRQENNCNRSGWKGRDLPKGVSSYEGKRGTRYYAQIGARLQKYRLGVFDTPDQAHAAYCAAAARLHGQFARFE